MWIIILPIIFLLTTLLALSEQSPFKQGPQLERLLSCCAFIYALIYPLVFGLHTAPLELTLYHTPTLHFALSLCLDRLAWIMSVFVSFIGVIIYQYSHHYLATDTHQARFMGLLGLLLSSVLLLVMSANLLTAWLAWCLIGIVLSKILCHFKHDSAIIAAKNKRFISKMGDTAFLLALIVIYWQFGDSDFNFLIQHAEDAPDNILAVALCFIFVAAMTKSVQWPFHRWLPETMEAPTPVSAVMHAGVVNAGGFLAARLSSLYLQYDFILLFICMSGLITMAYGAIRMMWQFDIKRKLAYSTISQMGYMMLQCGLGAFCSAVFHLMAHGLFKGYLFLASGSNLAAHNMATPTPRAPRVHVVLLVTALIGGAISIVLNLTHLFPALPALLYGFVLATVASLITQSLQQSPSRTTTFISLVAISLMTLTYLLLLTGFEAFLKDSLDFKEGVAYTLADWMLVAAMVSAMVTIQHLPVDVLARQKWYRALFARQISTQTRLRLTKPLVTTLYVKESK